jgi:hypothetical protein
MASIRIVANGNREIFIETINRISRIPGLKVVFIKQSDEKLYIVTERVFNVLQEDNNDN